MNVARRTRVWATALMLSLVVGGCGEAGPPVESSKTEATVRGTVKVRGKLAAKGKVFFNPANARRKDVSIREVPIGTAGTYEITTLVGENGVSIGGTGLRGDTGTDTTTFDVASGENTFDIEMPPPQ